MKKITLLFILVITSMGYGQNMTLSLENATITNDGMDDFYEVDVFISSDTDYTQGSGQFLFNYNTAAFGDNVQTNGNIEYIRPLTSILGSQSFTVDNYNSFVANDNTTSRTSFLWQQFWSSGTIGGDNVTATPSLLVRMRIKFANSAESPDVCFDITDPFDDQFFTACGPFGPAPAGADCGANPGTQILNYTPECGGGVLTCTDIATYTAGGWVPGAPTSTSSVVISSNYNSATDGGSFDACEVTVDAGVSLTIGAGDHINVQNDITVNGTLTVQHQGSVVQVENDAEVINNGTIDVNVTTPSLGGRDFMVMGSPVTDETREAVLGGAFRVKRHLTAQFELNADVTAQFGDAINFADENTSTSVNWVNHTGGLNPGEGYFVRPQTNGTGASTYDYVFNAGTTNAGTLNTGDVSFATVIGPDGAGNGSPNVLANPYASAVSATAVMTANGLGELYFWEHNTQPNVSFPGQYLTNFSMGDISMINSAGVGNPAATGGSTPTNVLASMQGFGIKAPDADAINFDNSMRITDANTTLRDYEALDRDILRLNVSSVAYERGSTTTVAFLEEASVGFDEGLDNKRMANIVSIYSHLDDASNAFGIQSRELFSDDIKIPVGFSTLIDEQTTYRITLSDIEGSNLLAAEVFLIDNYKGTVTNLNDGDYEFNSVKGRFDARFTLQFRSEDVLGTSELSLEEIDIYPNPTTGILNVVSAKTPITGISIYDIQGRKVNAVKLQNDTTYQADFTSLESAVYFMIIDTEKGSISRRIIKE